MDGTPDWTQRLRPVAGGDAVRGAELVSSLGCGACHLIPGVLRATGTVGPSLEWFAERAYIAGEMPNHATALVDFLVNPAETMPQTVMPDTGLSADDAAHVAAFLYTLTDAR